MKPLALSILAAAVVLAACGSGERRSSSSSSPTVETIAGEVSGPAEGLTLADGYQHMADAITREGSVFHTELHITHVEVTPPQPTPTPGGHGPQTIEEVIAGTKMDIWIDTNAELARIDQSAREDTETQNSHKLVRSNETLYTTDGKPTEGSRATNSLRCRESDSPLLSQLMLCGNYLEKAHTDVLAGHFGSQEAIVLVTEGTSPDSDRKSPFTARFYLDKATWLPIAAEYHLDYGSVVTDTTWTYENEFLTQSSLAADFFEPSAIGYVPPDPESSLKKTDPGIPVYWLGLRWNGTAGRPDLELTLSGSRAKGSPYRVTLTYSSVADPHGPAIIGMQEFLPDEWNGLLAQSHGGNIWEHAVSSEDIPLADGHATLFKISAGFGNRYLAHVFKPATVIMVTDFDSPSPYNNRDGFLAVIRELSVRQ